MKEKIKSEPKEVWNAAMSYEETNAYKESSRKPIYPTPDKIELTDYMADKLHDIGLCCEPIHQGDAALPIFSLSIMRNYDNEYVSKLFEFITPEDNGEGLNELNIYGLDITFVADAGNIACDLMVYYGDRVGAGADKLGTVGIMADGDYFFSFPYVMNRLAGEEFRLYTYETITKLCNWLGYLWRGIQHEMIYRPEIIQIRHHRSNAEERKQVKTQHGHNYRIAKVQRKIIISLEEDDEIEIIRIGKKEITLAIWSVAGHWRISKTGKKTWIAPYYKGKERNNPNSNFCAKEYCFMEE